MKNPKKLLFVISSLEGSGGSERALSNRVNYLVQNYDYDITIVCTSVQKQDKKFYFLDSRIKLATIPIDFGRYSLYQKIKYLFVQDFKVEKELSDFIVKENFDICSSFGSESFLYNFNKNKKFIKIKENRFTYKKMLTDEILPLQKKIWRNIRFRNAVKIQKKMDCVITLTEEDGDFWRKYLKNVVVLPNFINLQNISVSNLENKKIIAVGRLEKEKDFQSMIQSFKIVADQFPDWKLEIYGEGSLKEELLQLIQELNLQNQVFINNPVKNIYEKYLESSLYIHTAFYEGFPNTMLEAFSHGLPTVAFESVGGVKVLVENNVNGYLVQNRNIEILSNRMIQVISNSELQKEMGIHARKTAEKFSVETVMEKWHQFYQNI